MIRRTFSKQFAKKVLAPRDLDIWHLSPFQNRKRDKKSKMLEQGLTHLPTHDLLYLLIFAKKQQPKQKQ